MEKIGHREVVEFAGYLLNEETLIMNYITMAIVILIAFLASRNLKEVPTGWQNAIEAIAALWEEKVITMIGPAGRSLTPIFLTLFVYLVIANWLGLFPA
ncbi:MAG: F0F1 ATP synthase subunit A, partial [Schwartzia sp.]|nr:F0F1 ATP synthase subunit A [Schwartzia sp. (in: firmicutes)]